MWYESRGEIYKNWWGGGLVIVSSADHLFAGGSQQDGVFKLGRVAAFGVAQRRVGVDDAQVAEVLQCH